MTRSIIAGDEKAPVDVNSLNYIVGNNIQRDIKYEVVEWLMLDKPSH